MNLYNRVFGLLVLPPLMAIFLFVIAADPVTGDLTLLGGYLEEEFGWRDPQQEVVESAFKLTDSLDDYDGYYDVVVLGDSFSIDNSKGWQNRFFERTGLSVITFSMQKRHTDTHLPSGLSIESIVESQQFRVHPPRYFIFESVERKAFARLHDYANKLCTTEVQATGLPQQEPVAFPDAAPLIVKELRRQASPGLEVKIQQSVNYLVKTAHRLIGEDSQTYLLELTRDDLFSSRRSNRLLVLGDDMEKKLSGDAVEKAARGLCAMESIVEQNGKTRFMLLLFPDKLTVYAQYMKHPELSAPSYLPALATRYSYPRLDTVFQKELQKGAKDLYLPNDTHTGFAGYRLAADTLIDFYLENKTGLAQ